VQINLGGGDLSTQMAMNVFNTVINIGFSGGSTPAALDAFGYPVRNFTGTVDNFLVSNVLSTNGPWVLSWPAGRAAFSLAIQSATNASSPVNCTVTNGSGSGTLHIVGTGGAGSVTLNFVNAATTNLATLQFYGTDQSPPGNNWSANTGGVMSLVRQSDAAAYAAGQWWTPEFIKLIKDLSPRAIRPMGWNLPRGSNVDSNETLWKYRNTPSQLSWFAPSYPPTAWAGGAGTAGTITADGNGNYSCAAAADTTASGWADGEMIMGVISATAPGMFVTGAANNGGNLQLTVSGGATAGITIGQTVKIAGVGGSPSANGLHTVTATGASTVTINVAFGSGYNTGGGGALAYQKLTVTGKTGSQKLILNVLGQPLGFGDSGILVSHPASTFVYDKVLDCVLYGDGGLTPQPPLEAQCQLANTLGCRLWYNIPTWATDNYVTNALNVIFSNLTSILELELGNELWNFQFVGTQWCAQRASILGLGGNLDYQALRNRQIMGNLVPASSYGGAMAKINRLYAFQSGRGFGDTGITFYFEGQSLTNSSGQNAAYQAFVGGTGIDYSAVGSRPIDFTDTISYAPYYNGIGIASGGTVVGPFSNYPSNVTMFQNIINNTPSNIAAANAIIDNDIRSGSDRDQTFTVAGSPTTFTTPAAHNFSNNDPIQFKVTGGTTYAGIDTTAMYLVLSSGATTFTCGKLTNDIPGSALNVGAAGSGTTTVGSPHNDTVFFLANHNFLKWEAVAASYDGQRPSGKGPLGVEMYEGSGDLRTPNASQCTSLGLSAGSDVTLATAVINYKNSTPAKDTYIFYYNTYFGLQSGMSTLGLMAHSTGAAHLAISGAIGGGGGEFSLVADNNPMNPLPYQWYFGVQAFNTM
jgi:hypothetical protein